MNRAHSGALAYGQIHTNGATCPKIKETSMSTDNAEMARNADVVAADAEKRMIQKYVSEVPAPEAAPTARPWTSDFLLPSIRFREPKRH
jgi:hypothetical protein